jgi:hypothetical protein
MELISLVAFYRLDSVCTWTHFFIVIVWQIDFFYLTLALKIKENSKNMIKFKCYEVIIQS